MTDQARSAAMDRCVTEGEALDGLVLLAAHGDRRWRASSIAQPMRFGYAQNEAVYRLTPLGGDYGRGGGVRSLVRSEQQLIAWGWRVVA